MDDALPRPFLTAPRAAQDRTATAPPRPRVSGPVLMGDLTASWGGRPLLLWHWDRAEDSPGQD